MQSLLEKQQIADAIGLINPKQEKNRKKTTLRRITVKVLKIKNKKIFLKAVREKKYYIWGTKAQPQADVLSDSMEVVRPWKHVSNKNKTKIANL